MPINLGALWKAAGWDVSNIDNGNDVEEVLQILDEAKKSEGENPKVILTKTIKGKGISFMENNLAFHAAPINEEQYKQAIVDLNRAEASRLEQ
jgi:transketolase